MGENYRILVPTEQHALFDATQDDAYKHAAMLIQTCLYHGLRNKETVTLQRKHIGLEHQNVQIERKIRRQNMVYGTFRHRTTSLISFTIM